MIRTTEKSEYRQLIHVVSWFPRYISFNFGLGSNLQGDLQSEDGGEEVVKVAEHAVPPRVRVQRILGGQRGRGDHDADQDEVADNAVVDEVVAGQPERVAGAQHEEDITLRDGWLRRMFVMVRARCLVLLLALDEALILFSRLLLVLLLLVLVVPVVLLHVDGDVAVLLESERQA